MGAERPRPDLPELVPPRRHPLPVWARAAYLLGAVALGTLGLVGWLLPVVTGIPFIVAALVLLGLATDGGRLLVNRIEGALPARLRLRLRRALRRIPSDRIGRTVDPREDQERRCRQSED